MASPLRGTTTSSVANQLQGTKYLKTTGIMDAYEHVISTMIVNGWPQDKSIFEHAAYEVLKWAAEHKDNYRGLVGRNLGKKQDLIMSSRDNIPELSQYKMQQEMERHKLDVAQDIHTFAKVEKIQLKSRKQHTLTSNKLDVSIFQFRDRPIFKKTREPSPPPPVRGSIARESADRGGFDDIKQTRPTKKDLAKVQETDFTIDERAYKENPYNSLVSGGSMTNSLGRQQEEKSPLKIEHTETPMLSNTIQPSVKQS